MTGERAAAKAMLSINGIPVGIDCPLLVIAGPCVIENEAIAMRAAEELKKAGQKLNMPVIYKSSFHKANRTSLSGFRGPGMERGLEILAQVREQFKLPILSDVHEDTPLREVSEVVDVLQTPAFLCRQTNFIQRVAACGKPVNVKKGQFLSPWEMASVVEKMHQAGNQEVMVCERGFTFGYNNLVSDMRSLLIMRQLECPVIFDATHSVQLPGARGKASGGQREFVPLLARAAVAAGVAGVFIETHPQPEEALSDGASVWPLARLEGLLSGLKALDETVKAGLLEQDRLESGQKGFSPSPISAG